VDVTLGEGHHPLNPTWAQRARNERDTSEGLALLGAIATEVVMAMSAPARRRKGTLAFVLRLRGTDAEGHVSRHRGTS
jgi:hypothetical protein